MKRILSASFFRLFCPVIVLALTLGFPRAVLAADDGTVRGVLAACDAGDSGCLIDILSPLQAMIYISSACPDPEMHEDEAQATLVSWLHNAVAKDPAVANRKAD